MRTLAALTLLVALVLLTSGPAPTPAPVPDDPPAGDPSAPPAPTGQLDIVITKTVNISPTRWAVEGQLVGPLPWPYQFQLVTIVIPGTAFRPAVLNGELFLGVNGGKYAQPDGSFRLQFDVPYDGIQLGGFTVYLGTPMPPASSQFAPGKVVTFPILPPPMP